MDDPLQADGGMIDTIRRTTGTRAAAVARVIVDCRIVRAGGGLGQPDETPLASRLPG